MLAMRWVGEVELVVVEDGTAPIVRETAPIFRGNEEAFADTTIAVRISTWGSGFE